MNCKPLTVNRKLNYVIITPARNEEDNIERVIESMISQTVLPDKWVIVSDGSTDRTDDIVREYLKNYPWIELVRMPEHTERNFSAKVNAFNEGYAKIKGLNYDVIGNLDADISFGSDYFEFLLTKFCDDLTIGCAGTPFVEDGKHYDYRYTNIEHVSGACQLFRKECFEDIGGYIPINGGGIDWVAVTTARMKGWKTRTFTEKTCLHHRKMGTGNISPIMTWFKTGKRDYFLGNHPFWEIFRTLYQMTKKPYIFGGILLLTGYAWNCLCRMERPISKDLLKFIRNEQMERLKKTFLYLVMNKKNSD
ncbi:glycosyltransferase family 2 protein [bacterium]|nr:glycosyltransferase family 2 protein [candidate division CSSED10-310 bacterium]